MGQPKPTVTIDHAFQEFLAEQEARLSPATVWKYASILDLLASCLEHYWPGHEHRSSRQAARSIPLRLTVETPPCSHHRPSPGSPTWYERKPVSQNKTPSARARR